MIRIAYTFIDQLLHFTMSSKKLNSHSAYNYTLHNNVQFIYGGKQYFDLLKMLIHKAVYTIHLQYYIYDDDETGMEITDVLIEARKRNVQVFLLVDGYASKKLSASFIKKLKDAGIHFRFFEPLFKSNHFYFGRRLHHKLAIIDAKQALVGGMNISNRYNDMPNEHCWLDFALQIEGEIAQELCSICEQFWKKYQKIDTIACKQLVPKNYFKNLGICQVRIRRNDWVQRKYQISNSYVEMFRTTSSHITILSSYFLPGTLFRKKLSQLAKRDVKIRVILAGPSDVMLAKHAERYMYNWLLKNNIEIYEYQKTVLHGKLAVCDSKWLTLGSYNVNNISAYASIELNLDVQNELFSQQVEKELEEIIDKDCMRITKDAFYRNTNIFSQFIRWASYEIIRIFLFLFTFYFKQERRR